MFTRHTQVCPTVECVYLRVACMGPACPHGRVDLRSTVWSMGLPWWPSGKEPACPFRRFEMWVRSLGQEDPLEEEMATHSSTFA